MGTLDGAAMESLPEEVAVYASRRRRVGHMQVWGREWLECRFEEGGGRHELGEVDRMRLSKVLLAPCGRLYFIHRTMSRGLCDHFGGSSGLTGQRICWREPARRQGERG